MVFEAGHQLDGHTVCEEQHGHRWQISATVEGALHQKTVQVVDHGELQADLDTIADEFRHRDFNIMLPGVRPTPEGLATYIHERLVLKWPRIVEIGVHMGDESSVRVEWDVR